MFGFWGYKEVCSKEYYDIKKLKINVDMENGYAKIELGSDQSTLREIGTRELGGECRAILAVVLCSPRN